MSKIKRIFHHLFSFFGIKPAKSLPRLNRSPARLLDYGCASGGYLLALDPDEYQLTGIDFSPSALSDAANLGLSVFCEPVHSNTFEAGSFDIITSWMVLEHLYDPVSTLQKLHHWLADDGIIMVSVPDFSSFHRSIFRGSSYDNHVPQHLLHYNAKTIQIVMNKARFQVVEIRWQPNCRTLLMSIRNFLESHFPRQYLRIYTRLLDSMLGKLLAYFLGLVLAVIRQSACIEIIAKKS